MSTEPGDPLSFPPFQLPFHPASSGLSSLGCRTLLSQLGPLGLSRTFLLKHISTWVFLSRVNYAMGSNLRAINSPATPGNCLLTMQDMKLSLCNWTDKGLLNFLGWQFPLCLPGHLLYTSLSGVTWIFFAFVTKMKGLF
jgi:hypothetical protein